MQQTCKKISMRMIILKVGHNVAYQNVLKYYNGPYHSVFRSYCPLCMKLCIFDGAWSLSSVILITICLISKFLS